LSFALYSLTSHETDIITGRSFAGLHREGAFMALQQKFEAGEFAIIAEMEPPKGVNVAAMVSHAKRVKDRVTAFLVPEMSQAVMRMSALGAAMLLERDGMETVMQMCCRDRNRLALQGDLLAAAACRVRNIAVGGGEDPSYGDHHQARAVHDVSLLDLLRVIQTLQGGRDMTQRAEAGARFFITPPLFDLELIRPFLRRVDRERTIILPTVLLLKSLGMARYIERNMSHIAIPPQIIDRIQKAGDKVRECVRIAVELVAGIKAEGFKGVVLSTLGWEHKLPDIVEGI
jgi:methylenetetrahydrofolate reductase (NADPH)